MLIRDIKTASDLFLDCIATFNSQEIISYNELIYYTILVSIISLDRVTLKKKVVHSPEIVGAIREMPDLKLFLDSFVKCDYKTLFIKFGKAHFL